MSAAITPAQVAAPQSNEKTAEQVYKNIQVLKGIPASSLMTTMHLIKTDLGVDCNFCHVQGRSESDDLPAKLMARKMMQMMFELNKSSFGGSDRVTCYTCHRGSTNPQNVPIIPIAPVSEMTDAAGPRGGLPTPDQILATYVQALGGEKAIRSVTSRVITGTVDVPTGGGGRVPVPGQTEQYTKAPNLTVNIYHTATATMADGFDGATAWSQDAKGHVDEPVEPDRDRAKRSANFYESLDLKGEYDGLYVFGTERVNNRDAYVLVGYPQGDLPEYLYFDKQTGLLVRKKSVLQTSVGLSPFEVDYDNYRETNSGVKAPFVISRCPASPRTELNTRSTIRIQQIQDNAPIDNAKFAKPRSSDTPAK